MSTLAELFSGPEFGQVVIMDGGMGTTLQVSIMTAPTSCPGLRLTPWLGSRPAQAPPFELGLDSNLWSSELLATDEGKQTLVKLHQAWVNAGAQVIGSCT